MDEPKRVTVKDIIRYHRHLTKAFRAGFGNDLEAYRKHVASKRRTRRLMHLESKHKALMEKMERPQEAAIPNPFPGIENYTATGARILAAQAYRQMQAQANTTSARLYEMMRQMDTPYPARRQSPSGIADVLGGLGGLIGLGRIF